jgi:protein-tyrosine phosphatase
MRHIPLDGSSNFRDVGGYATEDGRRVRWGVVYRSGALWRLTEEDWQWMTKRAIVAVCDLRSQQERALSPTRWLGGESTRHIGDPYEADLLFSDRGTDATAGIGDVGASLYLTFTDLLADSFQKFFAALTGGEVPIIVHCSAGQDRTGFVIGLLLAMLGVPREVIVADYLLSTQYRRPENEIDQATLSAVEHSNLVARFYMEAIRRRGPDVLKPRSLLTAQGESFLAQAFRAIESRWGSIAAYLEQQLGIGPAEVDHLRTLYLEPSL